MLVCVNCQNELTDEKIPLFCPFCGQKLSSDTVMEWEGPWYPGKIRCARLRNIRKEIAAKNDIPYEPAPCNHEGDCPGTCPVCEQEAIYIERELDRKASEGRTITFSAEEEGAPVITGDWSKGETVSPLGSLQRVTEEENQPVRPWIPREFPAGIPPMPQDRIDRNNPGFIGPTAGVPMPPPQDRIDRINPGDMGPTAGIPGPPPPKKKKLMGRLKDKLLGN